MWLGVLTSRSWRGAGLATGVTVGETSGGAAENDGGTYVGASLQGFGTSAINPKGMLLYLALTPEFIRPHAGFSVPVQSAIFGPMFVASAAIIYTLIAAGSRRLLRSRPGAARGITLTSGIIMCLLGGGLVGGAGRSRCGRRRSPFSRSANVGFAWHTSAIHLFVVVGELKLR